MNADAAAERWRRVQAVLDAALAQPADAREAAVVAACGDDTALRDEALALLHHADVLPERVPEAALADWLDDAAADPHRWIGREIGAFVLEDCIGRGGSSLVFRARRRDEFAQRVAIKLLHGIGAPARRFLRERDVLAGLHHPNIARLYDAGTFEGMPYLVLEYIEGERWDLALASRRPSLRQRIADVVQVCDAVAYAHQRLCVHRDIKPANVMIDAEGVPRLLDFGIAKLLDEDVDSGFTRELGTPLTPAYAAPEQIRGEGATTATDVYALGVLLYEALTGINPFRRAGASTGDVLRAVAEGEAPRPSAALAQRDVTEPRNAMDGATPSIRPAALRGDLDNIVATAMAKDPAQRYASARHLADDLRAWLDGRPVLARTPTWRYLAATFARRHRTAVGLAALALLVLVAALGVASWQAREATRARALAEQRLGDMRRFVATVLFDYHEGIQQLEGSLPLQQRMVQDALRYLETLRGDAGDDASLWLDLVAGYLKTGDLQGNPYAANLGDFAGAKASYALAAQALERAVALAGDTRATRLNAARLAARRAHLLHQDTQLEEAAQNYRAAIASYDALADANDLDLALEHAITLDFYGDLLGRDGATSLSDRAGAKAAYARALALREAALARFPGNARLQLALYNSWMREGETLLAANDAAAAEAVMQRALVTIRALLDASPDDAYRKRELSYSHIRLAAVQEAQGKLDASIASALQAHTLMRQLLERDPDNEAMRQGFTATAGWTARLLGLAGRHVEAAPIVAQQIEVAKQRLASAPDNPEQRFSLGLAYRRLGLVRSGLGEFAQALAAHEEAERLQRDLVELAPDYAAGHALTMAHIGRAELALQRTAAARTHLSAAAQALAAQSALHPEVSSNREDLADAYDALADAWRTGAADCVRADAAWRQALDTWDAMLRDGMLSAQTAARRDASIARHAASPFCAD